MMLCGIYTITNKIDGKRYIGSSMQIEKRWQQHIYKLKKGNHPNKHLQFAWTKYGSECFCFEVLEECVLENLLSLEEKYINSYDFSNLYNLTLDVYGGGADTLKKPCYLLNLKGEIIKPYESFSDIARELKIRQITIAMINTGAVIKKMYRVTSVEFYNDNKEIIKTWKNVNNIHKSRRKDRLESLPKYEVIKNQNESIITHNKSKIARFLELSPQRINEILKTSAFNERGHFYNKKKQFIIKIVNLDFSTIA